MNSKDYKDVKQQEKKIFFNKNIYTKEAILEGKNIFSGHLKYKIHEDDKYYILEISADKIYNQNPIDELKNYILYYTVNTFNQ